MHQMPAANIKLDSNHRARLLDLDAQIAYWNRSDFKLQRFENFERS